MLMFFAPLYEPPVPASRNTRGADFFCRAYEYLKPSSYQNHSGSSRSSKTVNRRFLNGICCGSWGRYSTGVPTTVATSLSSNG